MIAGETPRLWLTQADLDESKRSDGFTGDEQKEQLGAEGVCGMKRGGARAAGFALNALLRAGIAGFLVDVLRHPHDPRYAGKAIPVRNLVIVGSLSLAFPLLALRQNATQRTDRWPHWTHYPVWSDDLYLSMFWLDMAGNYGNLYDRYMHFDLIPHFHGSGAVGGVLLSAFDLPPLAAIGAANGLHAALEAQEYLTDVFFGTHNVRGWWDSAGDLLSGFLGIATYVAVGYALGLRGSSRASECRR